MKCRRFYRTLVPALLFAGVIGHGQPTSTAAPAPQRSYEWLAEVVSVDAQGRTATLKARIPDYVVKYVDRFRAGERLLLVWNMIGKTQSDTVLALWDRDPEKDAKTGHHGFVLPIEYVSADGTARTVTFTARIPAHAAAALKSLAPGRWFKATSPLEQPSEEAAITAVDVSVTAPPAAPPLTKN